MFGPIGWALDKISGFVGDVATDAFQLLIGGLVAWVLDAVVWIVQGVFNYFLDSTDPNVQADWFITGNGPYATMAGIGATLMVGFVCAGITQGVLSGDVGGMLRRMALDLPMAVLGMVGLVTVTQALIRLTDELSTWVLSGFQEDMQSFVETVGSLASLGGGVATALVVFLLGLVAVLSGIVLIGELAVRAALVYIVVALAPLVFAAQLWPALKGITAKLLKLLAALIVSKLVIAVALAVAAAAAVGTGSGGEVTALPEPEAIAEDPGGSVTQAVGILLATGVAFAVAAFSPLLVARLLPLAEDAAAAQGIRGMPMRAAQQTLSTAYSLQMLRAYRYRGLASGRPGAGGTDGGDSPEGGGPGGSGGGGGPRGSRPSQGGKATDRAGASGQRGGASAKGSRSGKGGPVKSGTSTTGGKATAGGAGAGGAGAAGSGAAGAGAAAGPPGLVAAAAATAAKEKAGKVTRTTKGAARAVEDKATSSTDEQTSRQSSSGRQGPGGSAAQRGQANRQPRGSGSGPSAPPPRRRQAPPPRKPKRGDGG